MISFIILLIGYIMTLSLGVYTLIYIYKHQANFGIKVMFFIAFFTFFCAVIVYPTFFMISVIYFFSETINILIWKLSLIFGFIILIFSSIIYTSLKEFKNIPFFPFLLFISLFGLLIGIFFSPDSISIITLLSPGTFTDPTNINYIFNPFAGIVIIIFQFSFAICSSSLSYMVYTEARNKELAKGLMINAFIFFIPFLMYTFYIIFHMTIFRELHILFLWGNIASVCYRLVKKPSMLLELTNKIYYINIYHKSGVLLYSYRFGESDDEIDSTIWGNILIGINHILSEFVDSRDQIEVLQTDASDIIVNYDPYGFAVVIITNRKNSILKRLMDDFTMEFRQKFEQELSEIQDLNKLINVSEFNETKEIIEKNFQIYL